MVKPCLAVFDRVFVSDPSFILTFAQKQSCRFSRPLQLLFWPNFMFQCKIWSFGRSKSAKNHTNSVTVLPFGQCLAGLDIGVATRRPSAILACRAHTPSLSAWSRARFRLPVPLPRVARSAQQSRATLATARRAGADSGHLSLPCLNFLTLQAAQPRPTPSSLHLVLD